MKVMLDGIGVEIPTFKCKRPSFSEHRGRFWQDTHLYINGERVSAYFESVFGEFIYFEWQGDWRKVRMQSTYLDDLKGKSWDIDPTGSDKPNLTIA